MLIFGLTILTGSFLLFLVQPLIAKFILPWFGGTPAVWTTCMLFFQLGLLGGYAYTHLSIRKLEPRRQVLLHAALIGMALLLLPITPGDQWKPADGTLPTWRIFLLLTACIGLPYFVLSATGPLLQAWLGVTRQSAIPYRLYALSNLGSLLALAGYPFFIEPYFSRTEQALGWSAGLVLFSLFAVCCGRMVWKRLGNNPMPAEAITASAFADSETVSAISSEAAPSEVVPTRHWWIWFLLPACGSVLLLAVTNKISQDIAVIPFLWVLPLGLYLLSFIISFDNPRWYWRPFWIPVLALALAATCWMMVGSRLSVPYIRLLLPIQWLLLPAGRLSMFDSICILLATLFCCCMVCHGELYRMRPPLRHLTGYYLMIAAGGAFGGLFVALLAPLAFQDYFELHASLFATALLAAAVLFMERTGLPRGWRAWGWTGLLIALVALGAGLGYDAVGSLADTIDVSRGFYGVLKLSEHNANDPEAHELTLKHGSTEHGIQYFSGSRRRMPTAYYTAASGVGRALAHFPRKANRRVGVVGLGVGTLAAMGNPGDYFRFYEINDQVRRLALDRFWYIGDSAARIDIVLGDARLSMEQEPNQQFDILVLDAFRSDAVPVHLLTREAFEVYLRHLQPDGVIAVHISNRYLNLEPVITRTADHFAMGAALIYHDKSRLDEEEGEEDETTSSSDWILLTKNLEFLKLPAITEVSTSRKTYSPKIGMWTDDASNLLQILDVKEDSWLGWLRQLSL